MAAAALKVDSFKAAARNARKGLGLFDGQHGVQNLSEKLESRVKEAEHKLPSGVAPESCANELAAEAHEAGGRLFREGNLVEAKSSYVCAIQQTSRIASLKAKATVAVVCLRLGDAEEADEWASDALQLIEGLKCSDQWGSVSEEAEGLFAKLQARQQVASLICEVASNYSSTVFVTAGTPIILSKSLAPLLCHSQNIFFAGQFRTASWRFGQSPDQRFLPTVGILSCNSIFAWAQQPSGETQDLVATFQQDAF